jgi:hypothetical protein
VTGDQYQSDPIEQYFLKLEIKFNRFNFSMLTRGQLFSGLKQLLMNRKIELLDDTELLQQLRNLHEENSRRGHNDVQPSSGKDDRAVALALVVREVRAQERALPFEIVSRNPGPTPVFRGDPANCPWQAPCLNCPDCIDVGYCLGYKPDPGLVQID